MSLRQNAVLPIDESLQQTSAVIRDPSNTQLFSRPNYTIRKKEEILVSISAVRRDKVGELLKDWTELRDVDLILFYSLLKYYLA